MLLSSPGSRAGRENIATMLWPDKSPDSAYQNLRVTVSLLRKALGGTDLVRVDENLITLAVSEDSRDDLLFERIGRPALIEQNFDAMSGAIDLYRGDFLPDDRYFDWTEGRRQELSWLYRRLVMRSWPLAVRRGQTDRATGWLEELMRADPSEEDTARILMQLYLGAGRRADAIRLYRQLKESLRTDLDVDPENDTTDLYNRARAMNYRKSPGVRNS